MPPATGTVFTKPVDTILGQARGIWQAMRPTQPQFLDRRTGERVDLLFALRARRVFTPTFRDGSTFSARVLLPYLSGLTSIRSMRPQVKSVFVRRRCLFRRAVQSVVFLRNE